MISRLGDFAARSIQSFFGRGRQTDQSSTNTGTNTGVVGPRAPGQFRDRFDPANAPGRVKAAYSTFKPTLPPPGDTKSTSVFGSLFSKFSDRFGKLGDVIKDGWNRLLSLFQTKSTTKPMLPPTEPVKNDGSQIM